MRKKILVLTVLLSPTALCLAAYPHADLTGNWFVDYEDFAVMAAQWLDTDPCIPADGPLADLSGNRLVDCEDFALMANQWLTEVVPSDPGNLVWIDINEPGAYGDEGFVGQMSRYETTNAQYCQYLNEALASGDIFLSDNKVYGNSGEHINQLYFVTYAASSYSQIAYSDGVFSVRTRDGYSMANHPVVEVSWHGATAFCDYYGYRLPTSREWSAVADYDGSHSGCGSRTDPGTANCSQANPLGLSTRPYTSPVGYYPSYGYGMNDMAGNVYEWISGLSFWNNETWYDANGGSYDSDFCCTAWNSMSINAETSLYAGFRVCR